MVQLACQSQSLLTSSTASKPYAQRKATESKVFTLIQKNWRRFEQTARAADKSPARYVTREFEEFIGCGVLGRGFIRLKCDSCDENKVIPFSCKRRGFCPSCLGRRMNEGSAFLIDHVLPHAPVRQWVISFPIPVRFWMARNPQLTTQALGIFHRALKAHYKSAAKKVGVEGEILTGAVTVVQRWGSALNLNIHFHAIVPDGVFVIERHGAQETAKFVETRKPTQDELMKLIQTIQTRMLRALQRRGLVKHLEAETGGDAVELEETIESICQGASVQYRIATGKNPGLPVRRIGSLGYVGERPQVSGDSSAIIGGYSIHAGTYVAKNNRAELERLCRYILRPPIAEERLELRGENVIYKLKSTWRDGTSAIMLSGLEFIEKLVAIIPQPKIHTTRFHGILAPHAAMRALVVPVTPQVATTADKHCSEQSGDEKKTKASKAHPRLRWAELLRRVFNVDMERCPCGGKLKFIAAIMDRDSISKILDHMGIPSHVPDFAPP